MKIPTTSVAIATIALLTSAVTAQEENEPDRTKVKPEMTEGIISEGSTIFTYVDEKKRRRLTTDVYRPAEAEGLSPAIVFYFGGGWQNGRPGLFAPLAQALAQRGYVCVVPEYRLSGEAPFPAAVHDAKAAVRWTRRNAKRFGIDPDRIACMGGSAGGHLAAFVSSTNGISEFEGQGDNQDISSEVQAAIVMCGPVDFLDPQIKEQVMRAAKGNKTNAFIDFMGGETHETNREIYKKASPITHAGAHNPPTLFIDGEFDRPEVRYTDFRVILDKHEIPNQFVLMPKGPHPFWNMKEWFLPTVDATDEFLKKHLQP